MGHGIYDVTYGVWHTLLYDILAMAYGYDIIKTVGLKKGKKTFK